MELNDFFPNAIINFKILKLQQFDPLSENIDRLLKVIVKHRNHPSVIGIVSEFTKECFSFNMITIEDPLKEISMLDSTKAKQATNIPL